MVRFVKLLVFLFFLPSILSGQDIDSALLQYKPGDLDKVVDAGARSLVPASTSEQPVAGDILRKLIKKAGRKEQKIINQLLAIGEERKIIDLQKIDKKLGQINIAGLVNLYHNLKSLRIKKFDLSHIDEIKGVLANIDNSLQQLKGSPKEYGDLSFFAGLTRDQLANVAQSPIEKQNLRFNALNNYNETIKSLAQATDKGSREKVADASERVITLQEPFGDIVPIAPKKGAGKVFITSDYGVRIHPVKKTRRFHSGVDLAGWKCKGWKVCSIGPGRVVKSGWETGYGYVVIVSHDIDGRQYFSRYAHLLKKDRLKTGTLVKAKDVVGYCNNSGVSTGSHLHFEVREGSHSGKTLDPKEYLPDIAILK